MTAATGSLIPPLLRNGQQQDAPEEQRHHVRRPYKCPLCDKAFYRLEHQTRHIRTHTKEKPHACRFRGCIKKFSRSDELIRQDLHSRTHSNPGSRRGKGKHAATHQVAVVAIEAGLIEPGPGIAHIMSSPPRSNVRSPSVLPPHSLSSCPPNVGNDLARYRDRGLSNCADSLSQTRELIISAGSRLEQRTGYSSHLSQHQHNSHGYHLYYGRFPDFSQYSCLQHISRLPSYKDNGSYAERVTKESSPGSSMPTVPPSPSFSHESAAATPDYTPLTTPAYSPRLLPHLLNDLSDFQLPSLRHLNLNLRLVPALAPMEPSIDREPLCVPNHSPSLRIKDIILNSERFHCNLPVPMVPKIAVQDRLQDASLSSLSSRVSSITTFT